MDDAPGLVARVADRVEVQAFDAHRVRAVTHLDVSREDVELALEAFASEARLRQAGRDRDLARRRKPGRDRTPPGMGNPAAAEIRPGDGNPGT